MRSRLFKVVMVAAVAVAATGWTLARPAAAPTPQVGLAPASIGVLTFGPSGVLFAADAQAATIYALELGDQAAGGKAGAADVAAIDQKIAAVLGTEVAAVAVKDLVIHPVTKNAYLSVMRGTGADAKPALLRVDGDGKIAVVALDRVKSSKVTLPNPPAPAEGARNPRADSITDMAFVDGKLIVAGLSNEEFASKLRSVPYPFAAADAGTSVEIFHGNHGRLETRSPVYTFIPYTINNKRHVIASYTCTPLVRFPLESLTGSKVVGTTIAELGNRNRPLDMILYTKGGREFLLMSNNSRGVMKIPTEGFGTAAAITEPVKTETGGVSYETVASMTGIEQMDQLDAQRSIVLARTGGALNLSAVPLP
jgi:hypothetical protein